MDKGKWAVVLGFEGIALGVESADFSHDVLLGVNGDFETDAQRLEYCKWLARVLNESDGKQS